MSAYVCVLDRSGIDIDPGSLKRLAEPLEIYGSELSQACRGPVGVAVRHGGNRRSVKDHCGPVADRSTGVMAALSGRMYGAVNGFMAQQDSDGLPAGPVTATRALDAFLHNGESFLAGATGSFVVMVADPGRGNLSVARDHLGGLKVYYYLDRRWLIAASEPAAILRHDAVARDIDQGAVARFLGFRFGHTDASFFTRIKELAPAHWLHVDANHFRTEQYWRFTARRDMDATTREKVQNIFLSQLGQSVANETSGLEAPRIAISLSGGLDSTAVAALAPREARLCSWYFDDTPASDERRNINEVAEYLQRPVHWTSGDGFFPLSGDYIDRFVHENSPHLNAFAALKRELYHAARQVGCERILVGDGGDALYAAQDYWLRDMLVGRQAGAVRSLAATVRKAAYGDSFARLALRRLVPVRHLRAPFRRDRTPWLTDAVHKAWSGDGFSPILPCGGLKYRFDSGIGAKHIEIESEERRLFAQCGIERGNPFWHWPLLESVLNLPAWWFYRDGRTKVLMREAMKGLLPEKVLDSPKVGSLGALFLRGMNVNRATIQDIVFKNPRSDWQRYVNRSWVEPYLSATGSIAFGHTILWRVISYELWYRRLIQ